MGSRTEKAHLAWLIHTVFILWYWEIVDAHQEVETDAKIQRQEIARGCVQERKREALVKHRVFQGK